MNLTTGPSNVVSVWCFVLSLKRSTGLLYSHLVRDGPVTECV